MNRKLKNKTNAQLIGLYLCIIGCLFFQYYVRAVIFLSQILTFNFITILGIIITLFSIMFSSKENRTIRFDKPLLQFVLLLLISLLFGYTQHLSSSSPIFSIKVFSTLVLPLVVVIYRTSSNVTLRFFSFFLKSINIIVAFMITTLIIDVSTNNAFIKEFASVSSSSGLERFVYTSTRHASFMGHYLYSAEIYLLFYILNMIDIVYLGKKSNPLIYLFIASIGVASAASKTNIIALLLLIFLFNIKKIKYLIVSVITLTIIYFTGVFDVVIKRFLTTDLTTGRDTTWTYILNNVHDLFHVFWGHGADSIFSLNTFYVPWASAAFEYPIRLFEYEYGIVFTVLIYIFLFIIPAIYILKSKQYYLFCCYSIISIVVNTYNGIGINQDQMTLFCLVDCLMINLSICISNNSLQVKNKSKQFSTGNVKNL